jgi:PAS domain S-box-containing protein
MTRTDHSAVEYRSLAAAIPGCAAVQVGETLTYVDEAFAAASGAAPGELTGGSWRAAVTQEGAEPVQSALGAARADGQWRGQVPLGAAENDANAAVEVTLRAIDGDAVVWVLDEQVEGGTNPRPANRAPESDDGNAVNRAPDAPTVDLAFAQTLLDVVDDVAYVIGEDGFRYWNDALAETTGYSQEELAGMDPQDLIPADQEEFVPGLLDAIDATEDRRVDVDIMTADGERITHEFTGTTFEEPETGESFRCGIARDVTRQREREQELERYETIVETVDDGVYVLDDEFRIQYVNDRFCDFFGMSRAALLGMDARNLYEDASELDVAEEIRESLLERGDERGTIKATFETDDGERVLESRYRLHPEPDGEYRGSIGVVRDVTEHEARAEELRRQRTLIQGILNTIPDVVFAFNEAGEPIVEEAMLDEWAGYSGDELSEMGPFDVVPAAQQQGVIEQIQAVLGGETVSYETDVVAKDGTRIPHEFRAAPLELDGEVLGVVGSARDITERREREQAIARQRDELATLDRINRLLLETTREVIQSGSREAVERAVCERLADSDLYQFAWVGKQEFDGDRILPSVTAGVDHGYLDEVTVTATENETAMGPAGRAMQTGVVQIADVGGDESDTWRATASDHGFESVAAVPLLHGDTVYGVLAVYATREDAFSPREQDGFDVLGRSVGAVIHAARSQELLFADAVVELEFRATDVTSLFQRAARELDCTLSLDGYVAAGEEWILYLAVENCRPAEFVTTATEDDRVERARVVSETETGGRVELVVSESLLHAVSEAGASLQSATATADAAELVVEAPASTEVREIVGHVRREYESMDLVATRERDREITTVGRPGGLVSELTARQREALEAAYRAGYFAWPRESTAEEVAASLGLAAPTLHGHLRKAEHQLLAKLFDAGELGDGR